MRYRGNTKNQSPGLQNSRKGNPTVATGFLRARYAENVYKYANIELWRIHLADQSALVLRIVFVS